MDRWIELFERAFPAAAFPDDPSLDSFVGPIEGLFEASDLAAYNACAPATAARLAKMLADPRQRHLVKLLAFTAEHVPEPLLKPMLAAGALTNNPSFNRHFIEPCVLVYGRRPIVKILMELAYHGTDEVKAGAANALYWGSIPRESCSWMYCERYVPYEGPEDESVSDLAEEFGKWALAEFVRNEDVDVRRALVFYLENARGADPAVVDRALEIARNHSDSYIRDRLRYQMRETLLAPCMPPRNSGGAG